MNKKLFTIGSLILLMVAPIMARATLSEPNTPNQVTGGVIDIVNTILDFIWPVFIGFAVIMFVVAGFFFLTANGEPGKLSTARTSVIWGIVGVAVGVIAFSIPYIIQKELVGN